MHKCQLPDSFKEFYKSLTGKAPSDDIIAQARRELYQAVLKVLLQDPSFLEAYAKGLKLQCPDDIIRWFLIRIFAYSADYPERYVDSCLPSSLA